MENFFNYISKPVHPDDVQVWLNINNIIPEKVDLYSDFTSSLYKLILNTYLGGDDKSNESNIKLTEEDNTKHFDWCWKKTIENFTKENVKFYSKGEHYDHFKSFFDEVYYNQKDQKVKYQIGVFFED